MPRSAGASFGAPGVEITLRSDGTRLLYLTEGAYDLGLEAREPNFSLLVQDVRVTDGTDAFAFPTAEQEVARLRTRADGEFDSHEMTLRASRRWIGTFPGGDPVTVNPGTYDVEIEAAVQVASPESPPVDWEYWFTTTRQAGPGEDLTIDFGGSIQITLALGPDETDQVEQGTDLTLHVQVADAYGNEAPAVRQKGQGTWYWSYVYPVLVVQDGAGDEILNSPVYGNYPSVPTADLAPGTYQAFVQFDAGPLGPQETGGLVTSGRLSFTVLPGSSTPPPPAEGLVLSVTDSQGEPVKSGWVQVLEKRGDAYARLWTIFLDDGQATLPDLPGESAIALVVMGAARMGSGDAEEGFLLFEPVRSADPGSVLAINLGERQLSRVEFEVTGVEEDAVLRCWVYGLDAGGATFGIEVDSCRAFAAVWLEHGQYVFQAFTDPYWARWRDTPLYQLVSEPVKVPDEVPAGGTLSWSTDQMGTIIATPPAADETARYDVYRLSVVSQAFPPAVAPVFYLEYGQPVRVLAGTYQTYTAVAQYLFDSSVWTYWFERPAAVAPGQTLSMPFDVDLTVHPVELDRPAPAVCAPGETLRTTHRITNQHGDLLVGLESSGYAEAENHYDIAPFLVLRNEAGQEVLRFKESGWLPSYNPGYFNPWLGEETLIAGTYQGAVIPLGDDMPPGAYTADLELGAGPMGLVRSGSPAAFWIAEGLSAPVLDLPDTPTRETSVTLTGSAVPGAQVTLEYSFGGSEFIEAGTVDTDEDGRFSITVSLAEEGVYTFRALASQGGQTSGTGTPVQLVVDRTAPSAPTDLQWSSPVGTRIDLTWQAPPEADVARYRIERDGVRVGEVLAPTTTFQDTGLTPATEYRYAVRAVDQAGNESDPAEVTATTSQTADTEPPTPPVDLQVELRAGAAELTWGPATDNAGVVRYIVYRAVGGGEAKPLAEVPAGAERRYTDEGLQAATTYTYTVTAVDAAGNESLPSGAVTVTTPALAITSLSWQVERMSSRTLKPGGRLTVTLRGDGGRTALATVKYETWADADGSPLAEPAVEAVPLPLAETQPGSGVYTASLTLPETISRLLSIEATLSDGAGHEVSHIAFGLPLPGPGSLRVVLTPPEGVDVETMLTYLQGASIVAVSAGTASAGAATIAGTADHLLTGLVPSSDYRVYVQTPDGYVRGEARDVSVEPGREEVVNLELRLPASLALTVSTPDGATRRGARVSILDEKGTALRQANLDEKSPSAVLHGFWASDRVTVQVWWVPSEFRRVPDQVVTLQPGRNDHVIQLEFPEPGTLLGRVVDEDGEPLGGMTVTATQWIGSATVTERTTTNEQGEYSLSVFPGSVSVQAAKPGTNRASSVVYVSVPEGGVATRNLSVSLQGSTRLDLTLQTRYVNTGWQTIPLTDWNTVRQYNITVRTSKGTYSVYTSPTNVWAKPGEVLTICADGSSLKLSRECVEATVGDDCTARASLSLEQRGGTIRANLTDEAGGPFAGDWEAVVLHVTGSGRQAAAGHVKGSGHQVEVSVPEEGNYRIAVMAGGLTAESGTLSLRQGNTATVDLTLAPGPSFQGHDGNGVSASRTTAVPGAVVTFRARYQNAGPDAVGDAALWLEIPEGTTLVPGSVVQNGAPTAGGTEAPDAYHLPLGTLAPGETGWASWQLRLADSLDASLLAPGAQIRYGPGRAEPLGRAVVEVAQVTLNAPAVTTRREFTVSGRAPVGAEVHVYDGSVLLGTAAASPVGLWWMDVMLTSDPEATVEEHWLRATVLGAGGALQAETIARVLYDAGYPELQSITMRQSGRTVTVDPRSGVAHFPFSYAPKSPLVFSVDFSSPGRVQEMAVRVEGSGGGVTTAQMDTAAGQGVATASIVPGYGLGPVMVSYLTSPSEWSPGKEPSESDLLNSLPDGDLWAGAEYTGEAQEDPETGVSQASVTAVTRGGSWRASITLYVAEAAGFTPSPAEVAALKAVGGPEVYNLSATITEDGTVVIEAVIPTDLLLGQSARVGTQAAAGYRFVKAVIETGMSILDLDGVIAEGRDFRYWMNQLSRLRDKAAQCGTRADFYTGRLDELADQLMRNLIIKYALGLGGMALSLTGIGLVGSIGVTVVTDIIGDALDSKWEVEFLFLHRHIWSDPQCKADEGKVMEPAWIVDPSGFVYEAVESNRLEGVTATIFYRDGDTWIPWDAEWYGQVNPVVTDGAGRYAWDVPDSEWQVLFEKEGYEPAHSPVLTVPPIHTDVNIGLRSLASPSVEAVRPALREGVRVIEVRFSQYMRADTLTTETITVTAADGALLEGTVTPVEPEESPDAPGLLLTRTARFTPAEPFEPLQTYTVTVDLGVQNYLGRPMADSFTESLQMPEDLTPPAPPAEVGVESGDGELRIAWTDPADPDLKGIRVQWQAGGAPDSRTVDRGVQRAVLTGLVNGEIYDITLTAIDDSGNESEPVLTAGSPADVTPPGPVTPGAVEAAGVGEAILTWTDPTDPDFRSVQITWDGGSALVHAGAQGYPVSGLEPLKTYTFTLVARDGAGNESEPRSVTYRVPDGQPPGDVSDLKVRAGTRSLHLSWVDPANEDLKAIRITWRLGDGLFGPPVEVPAGVQQYTISGLKAGQTYEVRVEAVDAERLTSAGVTASGTPQRETSGSPSRPDVEPEPQPEPQPEPEPEPQPQPQPEPDPVPQPEPTPGSEPQTEPQPGTGVLIEDPAVSADILPGPVAVSVPGLRPVSPVYRLTASPGAEPALPIAAAFSYSADLLSGADPRTLGIYRRGDDGTWTYVGGVVETAADRIHGSLPGPGDYAVMLYDRTFADLAGHWARTEVEVLAARHVVDGVSESLFEPDRTITRAEFTKLLVAMLGAELVTPAAPTFRDVGPDAWYYRYVETAARLGLVRGSDGKYRPDVPVTREEMAAMMVRALSLEERAAQTPASVPFSDAELVSDWARGYVTLAVQEGLLQGMPDGTFRPGDTATRAQAAAVILRAMNYLGMLTR